MHWAHLLVAAALLACVDGAVLRATSHREAESLAATASEGSSDWAAYLEAESEDRRFLLGQLGKTEDQLLQLQKLAEALNEHTSVLSGLQISAAPEKKAPAAKPVAKPAVANAKVAAKSAANATKTAAKKESSNATEEDIKNMDPAKLVASLGIPSLKLKGTASLAPMLAMLKGLYEDSKSRISEQNTREEKSKKWFATKEAEHKAKVAKIEDKWKNHKISEELHTNETRDESRYFSYWSRCRERQHRQFHTNLKIQHAMMQKVKMMIGMYEKTLSGKAGDQEKAKKQLSQVAGGMPEVVLLQEAGKTVLNFCRDSLVEVQKEQLELRQMAQDGTQG